MYSAKKKGLSLLNSDNDGTMSDAASPAYDFQENSGFVLTFSKLRRKILPRQIYQRTKEKKREQKMGGCAPSLVLM